MRYILATIAALLATAVGLSAHAAEAAQTDVGGLVSSLLQAVQGGQWRLVGAVGLMLLVHGVRWLAGSNLMPWLKTDRGGAVTVLVLSVLTVVSTELGKTGAWSLAAVGNGIVAGMTAAGGWVIVKRLVWPADKK